MTKTKAALNPARAGTVAITAHLPKVVRNRLKILGIGLDRTMQDMIDEALADLFAKYGKPWPKQKD